jgi:hypothetical protein
MPGRVEGPAFVFAFAFGPESLRPRLSTPYSLLPIPCLCHPERSVLQRSRGTCFCLSSPVPSPLVPAFPFPCSLSLRPEATRKRAVAGVFAGDKPTFRDLSRRLPILDTARSARNTPSPSLMAGCTIFSFSERITRCNKTSGESRWH